MKYWKFFITALTALAALLVLMVNIKPVIAYFTTYAQSQGGQEICFDGEEEINVEADGLSRYVTVTNNKVQPVFVRARAFAGSVYSLYYEASGWTDGGDGWWYADDPITKDSSTPVLTVKLQDIPQDKLEEVGNFNIAIVYESVIAVYSYDKATDTYTSSARWDETTDPERSDEDEASGSENDNGGEQS